MEEYDKLYHHGVLGMRWGIRKARRSYAKINPEAKKTGSTGKHYDEALKNRDTRRRLMQKAYQKEYDDAKNANKSTRGIEKKYKKAYNALDAIETSNFYKATLKDLNYENVQKGMNLMKKVDTMKGVNQFLLTVHLPMPYLIKRVANNKARKDEFKKYALKHGIQNYLS